MNRRRAPVAVIAIAAAILALDQITKQLIRSHYRLGSVHHLFAGLSIARSTNSGVAFSITAGGEGLVIAIAVAVIGAVVFMFATHRDWRWLWLPTGLIVGGALGNLVDRLREGAVTDFIKVPDWPTFNLADSAITIGVLCLLAIIARNGSDRTA